MKRGWLIVPWALFGLIVIGWLIYWNLVAASSEAQVAAFVAQQNASGAHMSYRRISRHGFPVLLRLEIDGVYFAPAHAGWAFQTARADLNVEMLNTQHLIFQQRAPIFIARHHRPAASLTARTLLASLRSENGALAVAGVEADDLSLEYPDKPGALRVAKLVANMRPDPRAAGDYQLAFDAEGVRLARLARGFEGFGPSIAAVRADVVIEHGAQVLDWRDNDRLGPWREAGGKLRFEALALQWGPIETTGTGQVGLDQAHRLSGRLALPVAHPAPVLEAIAAGPKLSASARRALQSLAAGYVVNGRALTLGVDAHNGVLTIESLPVRALPPVY
jgi:hypothetical protein